MYDMHMLKQSFKPLVITNITAEHKLYKTLSEASNTFYLLTRMKAFKLCCVLQHSEH